MKFRDIGVRISSLRESNASLRTVKLKKMFIPWILFLVYLLCTVILNIFGPWNFENYETKNKVQVALFMFFFILISSLFYSIAIMQKNKILDHSERLMGVQDKTFKVATWISIAIYLLLLLEGISTRDIELGSSINIIDIISKAYYTSQTGTSNTRSLMLTVYILSSYIPLYAIAIGLLNFKKISALYKVNVVVMFVLSFLYNMLIVGSNKGFGDIVIIVISVFIIKAVKSDIKISIKSILFSAIFIVSIIYFFSTTFMNRYIMWGDIDTLFEGTATLNLDHWLIRYFPKNLAIGISLIIYYLVHGYYGLSLTFKLPFVWTMGLGSSFALRDNVVRLFNLDPATLRLTYPERMESIFGWGAYSSWHTIFPWLASDFTFIGSIVVVSFFVYLYAICWKQILSSNSNSSVVIFVMLNQFLLYIPANNQLFQSATTFIAFVFALGVWLYDHARIPVKRWATKNLN